MDRTDRRPRRRMTPAEYEQWYYEAQRPQQSRAATAFNWISAFFWLLLIVVAIAAILLALFRIDPRQFLPHNSFVQTNIISPQQTVMAMPTPQVPQEQPQAQPAPVAPVAPAPATVPTQAPAPVQEAAPVPTAVVPTAVPQPTAIPTNMPDTPYEAIGKPVDTTSDSSAVEPQPTKAHFRNGYCEGC
jgi:outer membrane biosynthesis protein TonB